MAKPTAPFIDLEHFRTLPAREITPGFHGRFWHSDHMTFVLWDIDQNADLPEHSHPHEQVAHMLEGEFLLRVAGAEKKLRPGDITLIPGHAPHSGKALTQCKILDIFSPKREDYVF